MRKNFQKWHNRKKRLHERSKPIYFHKKEIWWCSLGCNVGFEQDGKNDNFERPILVLKKFNRHLLLTVPLSTKIKSDKYYYSFKRHGKMYSVILSQLKTISNKRLLRKIGLFASEDFKKVKNEIKNFLN